MDIPSALLERAGFRYRDTAPRTTNGRIIVALHGSGADELTMLPLAQEIDPHARVITVRGRIDQNGERRWFLKHTPTSFDQVSILAEAAAFATFVAELKLDPPTTLFLGYSNGGNLVHATALLHPALIAQAALLRVMPVLASTPRADLTGSRFLVIRGRGDDTYGPHALPLVRLLRSIGARVQSRIAAAGHLFVPEDAVLVRRWLHA